MNTPRAPARRSRSRRVLPVVLLVLVAAGLFVAWWLQPERLAGFATTRLGAALGLSIRHDAGRMTLRPLPRLVLRGLRVGQPGQPDFLTAERVDIAMPWATVRGGGDVLDFERVDLVAPRIDLPALQRWLASRPPSALVAPRFVHGLHVSDGTVTGDGWRLGGLALDTPRWQPGSPADLNLRGHWDAAERGNTLDLTQRLHVDRVGNDTPLTLQGHGIATLDGARIAWHQRLTTRLDWTPAAWTLQRLRLAVDLDVTHGGQPVPAALGLAAGSVRIERANDALAIIPFGIVVSGHDPLPALSRFTGLLRVGASPSGTTPSGAAATGTAHAGKGVHWTLAGTLSDWPASWPALPRPLAASRAPIVVALGSDAGDGDARSDHGTMVRFDLARDDTRLQGRVDPAELRAWWQAPRLHPLPPINGRLSTPRLDLDGVQLDGVQVELHDDTPATSPP